MTANEAQMIVTEVLRQLGIVNGEISERKARQVYGKPFTDAVAAGLLKPIRVGAGKTATKHYRLNDILALQDASYQPAQIKI